MRHPLITVFGLCVLCFCGALFGGEYFTLEIGEEKLFVELADTEETRQQGLMFRQELEEGCGMLFVHLEPAILSYWMKDTRIPLSIGFFVYLLGFSLTSHNLFTHSSMNCRGGEAIFFI